MEEEAPAAPAATSRLCVKNLPKYVTEPRLKEHFSAKGEVTDVKVLRTKDGLPRQMGFVGFKSVADAEAALKYFDRTFMDTFKLTVEFARTFVESKAVIRPWSKHSEGSSAHKRLVDQKAKKDEGGGDGGSGAKNSSKKKKGPAAGSEKGGDKGAEGDDVAVAAAGGDADDAQLAEFLDLMQPRRKARMWSNDDVLPSDATKGGKKGGKAAGGGSSQAAGVRRSAAPAGGGERKGRAAAAMEGQRRGKAGRRSDAGVSDGDDSTSSHHQEGEDDEGEEDEEEEVEAAAAGDVVVMDAGVSDLDYLKSRMRTVGRWDDDDEEEEEEEEEELPAAAAAPSGRVFEPASSSEEDSDDEASASSSDEDEDDDEQKEDARRATGRGAVKRAKAVDDDSDDVGQAVDEEEEEKEEEKEDEEEAEEEGGSEEAEQDAMEVDDGDEQEDEDEEENNEADEEEGDGGAGGGGEEEEEEEEEEEGPAWARRQRADGEEGPEGGSAEASIMETGRLFVRNLPYTATEAELSELFGTCGDLAEVHLVLDRDTRRSKGLAYVLFHLPEDAVAAYRALDGQIFQGRLMHVLPAAKPLGARRARDDESGGGAEDGGGADGGVKGGAGSSFKAQREAQRKADAGNRAAWNTLFMRADTVAEAVAAYYGVSKSELLDKEAADLPVRMALGEAHVITQTKQALADADVDTSKLEAAAAAAGKAAGTKSVPRSASTLLVKNLPYAATEAGLLELFGRCGAVSRMVLPPTRTLALVEFLEPQDARAAFRSLAYKKYLHVPLYLEWAPRDVFTTSAAAAAKQRPAKGAAAAVATDGEQQQQQQQQQGGGGGGGKVDKRSAVAAVVTAAAGDEDDAPTSSIYVKNVSFSTIDAAFKKHFDKVVSSVGGQLRSCRVARKKGADGKQLSMGFGFVEVDSDDRAKAVIKQLQGSMLDGHKLVLQLSKGRPGGGGDGGDGKAAKSKKGKQGGGGDSDGSATSSTKLVVRNVAFEATRKDIAALFAPFGHLKSCRLPKKFDHSHRGFAFVELLTKQEAKNALEGVSGTHLYGRRLVVEFAKAEEGLDELRAKTAAKFRPGDEVDYAHSVGPGNAKRLRIA